MPIVGYLQVEKLFRVDISEARLSITYTFVNRGTDGIATVLWENTRVPDQVKIHWPKYGRAIDTLDLDNHAPDRRSTSINRLKDGWHMDKKASIWLSALLC